MSSVAESSHCKSSRKQRERVLLARKDAEEAPENHLEAVVASFGGKSETGGCFR